VPGDLIFKLYDTYGFPVDIVRDVVRDEALALDMDGFNDRMDQQREQSVQGHLHRRERRLKSLTSTGATTAFSGYEPGWTMPLPWCCSFTDGEAVDAAGPESTVEIVTDRTPFYGESGGQVGDRGVITAGWPKSPLPTRSRTPPGSSFTRGR
jgi:alanyl-tRNA synthetase